MKVDEEIREKLIQSLQAISSTLASNISGYLKEIQVAKTVEEIMRIKRDLLVHWITLLPLEPEDCYFCLLQEKKRKENLTDPCERCPYSRFHGVCDSENSDYERICNLLVKLSTEIKRNYYKNEIYSSEGR